MATTATPYSTLLTDLGLGVHHFNTDTFKVALLDPTYTPDLTGHTTWSSVSSHDITGINYTAGGLTLTGVTFTQVAANRALLAASGLTWTALTGTFHYAVVYNSTAGRLLGVTDFGEDRTYAAEDFQLTFPNGVVAIQRAA